MKGFKDQKNFNLKFIKEKLGEDYIVEYNEKGKEKSRIHIYKKITLTETGSLVPFFETALKNINTFDAEKRKKDHRGQQKAEIDIDSVENAIKLIKEIL